MGVNRFIAGDSQRAYTGSQMDVQSRRRFLRGSLALAGLGLLSACGMQPPQVQQRSKALRIGYLHPGVSTSPGLRAFQGAFLDGMRELGYIEGQDLTVEWRWAEGQEA